MARFAQICAKQPSFKHRCTYRANFSHAKAVTAVNRPALAPPPPGLVVADHGDRASVAAIAPVTAFLALVDRRAVSGPTAGSVQ